jgi:hypothetical protein
VAKRYEQMLRLVEQVKPRAIVEIGVHRGVRAEMLCREALKHSSGVTYAGYDVFDSADEHFQAEALNGKGAPSKEQAMSRLNTIKGLAHMLVVGDTRETLAGKKVQADFAFIDGDHRVEAIQSDYDALADCPCVVFDDYYTGGDLDLTKYGANAVVDALKAKGMRVEILPTKDRCNHGAFTQLAVVWK